MPAPTAHRCAEHLSVDERDQWPARRPTGSLKPVAALEETNPLLVLSGSLPAMIASQPSSKLKRQSVRAAGWLPARRYTDLLSLGAGVYVCDANPFSSCTATTLMRHRKCRLIGAPLPIDPGGTRAWTEKICPVFGIQPRGSRERENAVRESSKNYPGLVCGKSVLSMGDNHLEVSSARLLIRCGTIVCEVGISCMDKRYQAAESAPS